MPDDRLVEFNSVGIFNPKDWIEEGDGLLVSARAVRVALLRNRRKIDSTYLRHKNEPRKLNELRGFPRASMLLLGYAAEMYLKAGVVRVFSNCREEAVERWVTRKIGHNYIAAAKFVEFRLSDEDRERLAFLTDLVTKMRYPVVPRTIVTDRGFPFDTDHTAQMNERNNRIWSDAEFRKLCSLINRISAHVQRIDLDENNPASFLRGWIGEVGYWIFRVGGNLSPRVTYRLCPTRPDIDGAAVRKQIEADWVFRHHAKWNNCKILVDDDDLKGKGFRAEERHTTDKDG